MASRSDGDDEISNGYESKLEMCLLFLLQHPNCGVGELSVFCNALVGFNITNVQTNGIMKSMTSHYLCTVAASKFFET